MPHNPIKGYIYDKVLELYDNEHRNPLVPGISEQRAETIRVNCINLAAATHLPHAPAPVIELGIPLDALYYEATLSEPFGRQGYIFEIVGTYATPADPPNAPHFIDGLWYNSPTVVIAWRRRVRIKDSPLYVEARWSPTSALTLDIRGVEQDLSLTHMAQVPDAIALLVELQGSLPLGRPKGSGIYPTADDFRRVLVPIIQQLKKDGTYPSQRAVAELWSFSIHAKQLQRWFNQHIRPDTEQSWADFVKSVKPSDLLSF